MLGTGTAATIGRYPNHQESSTLAEQSYHGCAGSSSLAAAAADPADVALVIVRSKPTPNCGSPGVWLLCATRERSREQFGCLAVNDKKPLQKLLCSAFWLYFVLLK
jgi:type IV pilus biogenesis protein CpaD/CtpE